ncbi:MULTISPECIES: acyl-homoserine-lactone synthase [unclassified Pseudomonas]|uniref:acyl-homoserine-lactone synthase n=1 Tax=unclassified Pseudomonas TaxID=196821 RepID=UPI0030D9E8E6
MNYFPHTYGFSGVYTSIVSHSKIPLKILEQILSIRKLAFIDRKKWDIESYQGSNYEWDEYDDPDAIYIYTHQNGRVTGCVRLRPSNKPTLMSGPLSFILPAEEARPRLDKCWEATRFALSANNFATGQLTQANVDIRTAALFLSMIKFAQQQKIHTYEIVVDTLMEKILKRAGWTVERLNTALGSKGEKIIYGALPCTLKTYEEVLNKNAINSTIVFNQALIPHHSSDTLQISRTIAQTLPDRNIPAKTRMHTELQL